MQKQINDYFAKLCEGKFFINDDEVVIAKAKDIIEKLKRELQYVKNPENEIDEEEVEFIEDETNELIEDIQKSNSENDVIKIKMCAMSGFYTLVDKETLLEELKEYYDEERNENEN